MMISAVTGNYSSAGAMGLAQAAAQAPGRVAGQTTGKAADPSSSPQQGPATGNRTEQLKPSEQRELAELKQRDTEVRAHEAAHMAASGGLVRGGASFSYQQGPDGKRYAVGGEVSIDTSPVRDNPQATLSKAQTIRRAALAPADPSSQDRQVAAQAGQMMSSAQMELAKQRQSEQDGDERDTGKTQNYLDVAKTDQAPEHLLDLLL
jgi:hypothetical protein